MSIYTVRECTDPGCHFRFPADDQEGIGDRCPRCRGRTRIVMALAPHAAERPPARPSPCRWQVSWTTSAASSTSARSSAAPTALALPISSLRHHANARQPQTGQDRFGAPKQLSPGAITTTPRSGQPVACQRRHAPGPGSYAQPPPPYLHPPAAGTARPRSPGTKSLASILACWRSAPRRWPSPCTAQTLAERGHRLWHCGGGDGEPVV